MWHSIDVLLINLVCALQWFNPAAWLMRKNLKEIHEYEADAATLQSGISLKSYQDLLIKKAVGTSGHSIANSLNHSSLKNRLTMMYLKKSCVRSALKALYALPIVGISMAATAKTIVVYEYDKSETSISSLRRIPGSSSRNHRSAGRNGKRSEADPGSRSHPSVPAGTRGSPP